MIVQNNLNSGITLSLKDGSMCVLPARGKVTIKDSLLSADFGMYQKQGYIKLIREQRVSLEDAQKSVETKEETPTTKNPTLKKNNKKGGEK